MARNPLVGRAFRITAIVEGQDEVPIVERTEPTLSFDEASFEAQTGCNRLWAEYEVDGEGRLVAGERVTIHTEQHGAPRGLTGMAK